MPEDGRSPFAGTPFLPPGPRAVVTTCAIHYREFQFLVQPAITSQSGGGGSGLALRSQSAAFERLTDSLTAALSEERHQKILVMTHDTCATCANSG